MTKQTTVHLSGEHTDFNTIVELHSFLKDGMIMVSEKAGNLPKDYRKELTSKIEKLGFQSCKIASKYMGRVYKLTNEANGCITVSKTTIRRVAKPPLYSIFINGVATPEIANKISEIVSEYRNAHSSKFQLVRFREYFLDERKKLDFVDMSVTTEHMEELRSDLYEGINVDLMLDTYLTSNEAILVLTGRPGTGKTCMIKKAICRLAHLINGDVGVAYVKSPEVLEKDEFWATLVGDYDHSPISMLVLDDLDRELEPRGKTTEDRNVVSRVLSFSDGVFPSNIKILITTNMTDAKIDEALLRPGRCFDVLEMPSLSRPNAKRIWVQELNLSEEVFETSFQEDTEITQAYLMSEAARVKAMGPKKYLVDQNISARKKYSGSSFAGSMHIG